MLIYTEPHLDGDLQEVAGHRMLIMVEVKLESIELPFANPTALEATTQRCLAPAYSLQLTAMYVARGHHAGLERA